MARMTFAALKEKAGIINLTMPGFYHLRVNQRNGYTAIDLYNERNMVDNLMCGTPKECGQALDLVYRLRMNCKIN